MVQMQLKQKGKNRKLRIAKVRTKWESNILVADLFLTSGYVSAWKHVAGIKLCARTAEGHYIIEGLLLGITDFLSKIKKKFEEIRNLVTEKMDNIKSSAVSKVNEMKKGLSDGVERIKESFRSGFSTLVGYVKSPINSIIRFINNFLYAIQTMQNSFANALNSMSISLPHWLEKLTGFSSVGFNVGYWSAPMVPYLAQGAVIPPNREFMAVLGDQKSGNNIEAPESLIRRIVREESGNGKGSTYNVTAQVNRRTLFDLVLEEGKVRRTVTGRNPFETV